MLGITLGLTLWGALCASRPATPRPSFLLFVFDTTRADSVSAYGAVTGTTPVTDALAAAGIRYTRAYANASWTLPSHATIFTGLLPHQHGVNWRSTQASDSLVTLAERLREAGYETVGFSENPWVSSAFNMAQGFDQFTSSMDRPRSVGLPPAKFVTDWLGSRKTDRPFFLFINVIDAHAPYEVRSKNPFLPEGVSARAADKVPQEKERYVCNVAGRERDLAILRGLYLNGVAAADAKLGAVLEELRERGVDHNLVTIVTADHGEHFGEQGLFDHVLGVGEAAIRVPLIVHGGPGMVPATIETPVQLTAIKPSVLSWARVSASDGLGTPLPTTSAAKEAPAVIAEWSDPSGKHPSEQPLARFLRHRTKAARRNCRPADRAFGDMRTIIRYPLKLVWYADYPAELYNIDNDPKQQNNLASKDPSAVADLMAELEQNMKATPASAKTTPASSPPQITEEVRRQLRALGYIGDDLEGGSER